jgi:hypothetical protein
MAEQKVTELDCIWDEPITYELQVELLLCLQRIIEHFAAAAMSIHQCRPFDAVCIVIPGAIAAISDAIMRQLAVDEPSDVSTSYIVVCESVLQCVIIVLCYRHVRTLWVKRKPVVNLVIRDLVSQ